MDRQATCAAATAPSDDTSTGRWVLVATILASSMVFIDGSVVNVALPTLQRELNASAADALWVVESYALFLAALILVAARSGTISAASASSWSAPCSSPSPRSGAVSPRTLGR